MKQSKLPLVQPDFTLTPSKFLAPKRRRRKGKKLVWPSEKIKGNTGGLQLEMFERKGQQTHI